MATKKAKSYFESDEFRRRAEARAREGFNITPLAESEQIHRNYLKNQKAKRRK